MKSVYVLLAAAIFSAGCANVRVQAPKDPIKVDISMRLDIYQHVQKDIDAIEGIVSGTNAKAAPGDKQSMIVNFFMPAAYAEEALSPEVEQAALHRKDRRELLLELEKKGIVGENKSGLVEGRDASLMDSSIVSMVSDENADRMVIYKALAQKNNIPISEIQKVYAERLQKDAPGGTPIETPDSGWKIK